MRIARITKNIWGKRFPRILIIGKKLFLKPRLFSKYEYWLIELDDLLNVLAKKIHATMPDMRYTANGTSEAARIRKPKVNTK